MKWLLLAAACVLAAPPGSSAQETASAPAVHAQGGGVEALMQLWEGVHDTDEQVVYGGAGAVVTHDGATRRVHTIVTTVKLPWLGAHVLYLEEFLEDPGHLRRQVLLRLRSEPGAAGAGPVIRIQQYTFKYPGRWRGVYRNPALLRTLRRTDLETIPGCDLILRRVGAQFRGGTVGHGCVDLSSHPRRYVDYRMLIGAGLYWYRKRLLRASDDTLLRQIDAYDRFELHEARLFACRIRWSAAGGAASRRPFVTVDLPDRGGRVRFTAPDGQSYQLELHSGDWPFDTNRDALILVLQQPGAVAPLASSWAPRDAGAIGIDLGKLDVSCGSLVPDDDAVTT